MALRTFKACFSNSTGTGIRCRRVKAKSKTDAARAIFRIDPNTYVKVGGAVFYRGDDGKPKRSKTNRL